MKKKKNHLDALGILKTEWHEIGHCQSFKWLTNGKYYLYSTIEDPLKIIECNAQTLRKEAARYKNASLCKKHCTAILIMHEMDVCLPKPAVDIALYTVFC